MIPFARHRTPSGTGRRSLREHGYLPAEFLRPKGGVSFDRKNGLSPMMWGTHLERCPSLRNLGLFPRDHLTAVSPGDFGRHRGKLGAEGTFRSLRSQPPHSWAG